jgi:MbtH protein
MNHEERYSIWPADRELPLGWSAVGRTGLKAECLAYIEKGWTDMRPRSRRERMAEVRAPAGCMVTARNNKTAAEPSQPLTAVYEG